MRLDESQRAFCEDPSDAIRLLAPAGSGKTLSLLWRCIHLQTASTERQPGRFLVLAFTRAARDELRDRLTSTPDFQPIQGVVEISTLNSWGFRWLKQRLNKPQLLTEASNRYFCIMNVLRPVWENHQRIADLLSDNRRSSRAARQLMDLMDYLKSLGFRHDMHDRIDGFHEHIKWLGEGGMRPHVAALFRQLLDLELVRTEEPDAIVWEAYNYFFQFWRDATHHMYRSALLTLEDQKYWALIEIERAIRDSAPGLPLQRYSHIFVDEFQDVNALDLNLLRTMSRVSRRQFAIVGDDDQAIYEWRGATPEFILEPRRFIGAEYRTHILEVNYRSPRNIVELSQRLISHNTRRVQKAVRAFSAHEAEVRVQRTPTLQYALDHVLAEVRRLIEQYPKQRLALIGRKRSQIIPYQILFASNNIPFCAAEDLNVLLSTAFADLKSILLLKAQAAQPLPFGPDPVEGLLKICDRVRRYPLSKADRGQLRSHLANARPRTLLESMEHLHAYRGQLKGSNTDGSKSADFYARIRALLVGSSVAETITAISREFEGLQKDYGKSLDDIFYADPPFLYLADYARRYGTDFASFLGDLESAIAALTALPADDADDAHGVWRRPLHLMTALRAKGKEFDSVFLLDCNQGIWPSKLATTQEELEAERRLFYVAVTRTKRNLTFLVNARMFDEVAMPTQYLREMGLVAM